MQNRPDYSAYHLHELEDALAKIDQSSHPEEAAIIRSYIEKGGYRFPDKKNVTGVRFLSPLYKRTLVAVLTTMIFLNVLSLFSGGVAANFPLLLQGATLFMILSGHKYAQVFVQIWSALLAVSGALFLYSAFYISETHWLTWAGYVLTFSGGIIFFLLAGKYIEPKVEGLDQSVNESADK